MYLEQSNLSLSKWHGKQRQCKTMEENRKCEKLGKLCCKFKCELWMCYCDRDAKSQNRRIQLWAYAKIQNTPLSRGAWSRNRGLVLLLCKVLMRQLEYSGLWSLIQPQQKHTMVFFGLTSLKPGEQTMSFVEFQKGRMICRNTVGDMCCLHINYSFLSQHIWVCYFSIKYFLYQTSKSKGTGFVKKFWKEVWMNPAKYVHMLQCESRIWVCLGTWWKICCQYMSEEKK